MSAVWTPLSAEAAASHIGEGLHTGLRKGTEAEGAHELWEAISEHGEAWSDALAYLMWGLDYMGLALCEKKIEITLGEESP